MMHVEVQLSLLSVQLSHTHTMMGEKKSIAQEPSRGASLSDGHLAMMGALSVTHDGKGCEFEIPNLPKGVLSLQISTSDRTHARTRKHAPKNQRRTDANRESTDGSRSVGAHTDTRRRAGRYRSLTCDKQAEVSEGLKKTPERQNRLQTYCSSSSRAFQHP